ncbi:cell wall protein RBR3-like, partial [Limulus polyphemus]|uniref:Cell wall protein RBR3-like n=1 Tax=Limulus polyphemus TaxID=6850 RepID=A0ABM1T0Y1_LIMPO
MSAAQKVISNQSKHSDERERSEQAQPIDLVQRVSTTSLNLIQSPLQREVSLHPAVSQPLRSHLDQSKLSFMNLNVRIPTASPRVPVPVVGSLTMSVTSSQAMATKNGSPAVVGLQAIPVGGTTSRHSITTNIQAVGGSLPMASIIRAPQTLVGHVAHNFNHPYSSHVPRGAAAVASISAAPKSAVATPILRPHSNTSTSVLSSTTLSSHPQPQIIARTPLLRPSRTPPPPTSKTASPAPITITHVIDFKNAQKTLKSIMGFKFLKLTKNEEVDINCLSSTDFDTLLLSTKIPEKGFAKTQASSVTTINSTFAQPLSSQRPVAVPQGTVVMRAMTSSAAHISQQHHPPASASHQSVTVPSTTVVSIASLPSVAYAGNYNPIHKQTLYPPSLQAVPHTPNKSSSVGLTVVSTKGASQVVQTVSPHLTQSATSTLGRIVLTTTVATSSNGVRLTTSNAPPVHGSVSDTSVQQVSAIPLDKVHTKVYPQLSSSSRTGIEGLPNYGNEITSQTNRINTVNPTSTKSGTTPRSLSGSSNHSSSFEAKTESNTCAATRLASVPQLGFPGGAQYAVPATAYYYESYPVHSGVTMHHFSGSSGTSSYAANVVSSSGQRPGILSQHVTTNTVNQGSPHNFATRGSSGPPVRSLSSVMVNIDSSCHHVAFRPLFTS